MNSSSRDLADTSGAPNGAPAPSTPDPGVAEWAVVRMGYREARAVGPVTKQTALRLYYVSPWGVNRSAFTDLSGVRYRGSEAACKALAEQLMSSRALADEERNACSQRHEARAERLIAAALGNNPDAGMST